MFLYVLEFCCIYIISPTDEWLKEQASAWDWRSLTCYLVKFLKGVGIKFLGKYGRMNTGEWSEFEYCRSDGESDKEAFTGAMVEIFDRIWPTRAYSLIRQKTVFRPTLQETKYLAGRGLNSLFPVIYSIVRKQIT